MKETVLKNVKIRWPFLSKPNTEGEFASNKYQLDIILEGDNRKIMEGLINKKQKIKERDGVASITLKSSVKPRVYDSAKALMSDEDLAKVGNDSVAHVKVTSYSSKFGDYAGLGSVKVIKVKEYLGDADFGDDDDDSDAAPFDDDEELI